MTTTAEAIAAHLAPLVSELRGSAQRAVLFPRPISAPAPGCLTFIRPGFARIAAVMGQLQGTTIICDPQVAHMLGDGADFSILIASNPRMAFIRALSAFWNPSRPAAGVHRSAVVASDCKVAPDASVGPLCSIGLGCSIGAGSILHSNVTLYANVRIGSGVVINSGTVIGADGFGYERNEEGELEKFPHVGGVVIEDNVEIGSNTSIDRGSLGDTVIREGARIDNQVHISHNVDVGRHTAVIAQSMLGGSVRVGDFSWIAPSAIILNQVKIGTKSTVGLGAVVVKDVPDSGTVMGSPATSADEFRQVRAALKNLIKPARD